MLNTKYGKMVMWGAHAETVLSLTALCALWGLTSGLHQLCTGHAGVRPNACPLKQLACQSQRGTVREEHPRC